MVRRAVSRFDLVHVTDGGDRPLAQSWQDIDIRTLHGEFGFFVAGEHSTVTDTGCVLHCYRIDTTTLSAECQQPCQPDPNRVAETPESVVQQRFSQHRRTSERNLLDSMFLDRVDSLPRIRQLCAKGPIRRSHQRTRRRSEMKGLSSTLQPAPDQPGRDRPAFPCPTGRLEPSHQSVSNPLTKVSGTLQLQVRHNVRERGYRLPGGHTRMKRTSKWQRNEILLTGSTRMIGP